jgi:branched-chain amino acid transport system substrate-binding protein
MVVNDKVDVLAGFGLTPLALATAPIATQSKTPMVVTAAATSIITEQSPYIVRTSFTLPQVSVAIAEWAAKNRIKKVVTFVADYGPGLDAEKFFKSQFRLNGGEITGEIRSPLRSPDFAPFLQRVADLKPDAVFAFLPSGQGAAFMKQFASAASTSRHPAHRHRRRDRRRPASTRWAMSRSASSTRTTTRRRTPRREQEVRPGLRGRQQVPPNFMAVAGYDGMRVIYKALEATKGQGSGDALLAAMKGQVFESPRGPVLIDAQTRDIVQDVYIRRVERVAAMGNQLFNVEFDVQKAVKDPAKLK